VVSEPFVITKRCLNEFESSRYDLPKSSLGSLSIKSGLDFFCGVSGA
jgi:hypothetical protein